ncbi:MAG: hypothetical protein ACKV2O_19025 [Acidimicrobiales bacterium]
MTTDREAVLATIEGVSGQVLLVTVSAAERPCVTPVSVTVLGEALVIAIASDHPVIQDLLERPFVTLLCPVDQGRGDEGGSGFVELQCLGDVLGEQILLTPLQAWRQPHAELLFAA